MNATDDDDVDLRFPDRVLTSKRKISAVSPVSESPDLALSAGRGRGWSSSRITSTVGFKFMFTSKSMSTLGEAIR